MSKVFEDEFMDIQIRMISTCLEGLEDATYNKTPEYLYIYAFDSQKQTFFNLFFVCEGKVTSFHDLGVSNSIIRQVLNYGMDDVEELTKLCKNRNRKAPSQYKLIYNIAVDKLETHYEYDDLTESDTGPADVFMAWKERALL